jgi:hypothetical protein
MGPQHSSASTHAHTTQSLVLVCRVGLDVHRCTIRFSRCDTEQDYLNYLAGQPVPKSLFPTNSSSPPRHDRSPNPGGWQFSGRRRCLQPPTTSLSLHAALNGSPRVSAVLRSDPPCPWSGSGGESKDMLDLEWARLFLLRCTRLRRLLRPVSLHLTHWASPPPSIPLLHRRRAGSTRRDRVSRPSGGGRSSGGTTTGWPRRSQSAAPSIPG